MPPRLNKRQAREQAELEALQAAAVVAPSLAPEQEEGDESDEAAPVREKATGSVFAALNDEGGQEDEDEDDDEEEEGERAAATTTKKKSKSKKKKKKNKLPLPAPDSSAGVSTIIPSDFDTPSTPDPTAKFGGAGAKKASSGKAAATKPSDDMDEIDRALAELAAKGAGAGAGAGAVETEGASHAVPVKLSKEWQAAKEVFSFDPKFLDSDAELRRMFGSKVINTSPAAPRSHHHARFANNPHHATSIKRTPTFLASPEPGWLSPGGVLSVTRFQGGDSLEDPGEWWTYQHSQVYKEGQLGFLEVLQQADGNRLFNILQSHPYHVDTLMQLSEMMAQQGDLGASSTYLSKALYALSAPLPPSFPSGAFRLPYSQIENRAFFLAVARKVAMLVKRGTWRTACEWAKIGLGVGGGADPVGMLLFIDFLAPKAKQGPWFLSLLKALPEVYPNINLGGYPGLAYAKALVLRGMEEDDSEDDTKSTAALRSAILRYPMVVPLLFTLLGGNAPPSLLSNRRSQVDGSFSNKTTYMSSLLSELYCARSSPLWKDPSTLAWLQKTVNATAPSLNDSTEEDVRIGERIFNQGAWEAGYAPAGVIRAAFISEIPSIRPYLPSSATTGTSYSYDPLPPPPSVSTSYNDAYFSSLYSGSTRRARGGGRGAVAGQGGGGGGAADRTAAGNLAAQLAQLLGLGGGDGGAPVELNDELREQLMGELAQLAAHARGQGDVPGGFPGVGVGEEGEEGEDGEGEEEEEEEDRAVAQNIMGRLAAMFRGGAGGGGGG